MNSVFFKKSVFFVLIMCLFLPTNVSGQLLNEPGIDDLPEKNEIDYYKIVENIITAFGVIGAAAVTAITVLHQRKGQQNDLLKLEYAQQKNRLELEYDINLREKRTSAYEKLWELTRVELQPNHYTMDKLLKWKDDLRDWYYKDGHGVLLSEHSQKLYHNFQNRLLGKSIRSLENNFKIDTPFSSKKFLNKDINMAFKLSWK